LESIKIYTASTETRRFQMYQTINDNNHILYLSNYSNSPFTIILCISRTMYMYVSRYMLDLQLYVICLISNSFEYCKW